MDYTDYLLCPACGFYVYPEDDECVVCGQEFEDVTDCDDSGDYGVSDDSDYVDSGSSDE